MLNNILNQSSTTKAIAIIAVWRWANQVTQIVFIYAQTTEKQADFLDKILHEGPILHPPILSLYAGADQPKIVYISAKTPFISAVKQVQKLISLAEKRLLGKFDLVTGTGTNWQKLKAIDVAAAAPSRK